MTTTEQILRVCLWLVIPLAFAVSVVGHELAHAAAAVLVRGRAYAIELGRRGLVWAQFELGGMSWTLRGFPSSGFTLFTLHGSDGFRWRSWLVIAAGPIFNAVVAAAALWVLSFVDGRSGCGDLTRSVARMVLWFQVFLLVVTLLPWRSKTVYGEVSSDGLRLVTVPWMKPEAVRVASEAHRSMHHVFEAGRALARHDYERACAEAAQIGAEEPMRPIAEWMRAVTMFPCDAQLVCDRLDALLASLDAAHPFRAEVVNSLAWFLLLSERGDVLARAETLSREALARAPKPLPHHQGTLGSILVEQGRTTEGRPLLEAAMRSVARGSRALNACYLARAALQEGEIEPARSHLERARRLDPRCHLLERTEERLAAAMQARPRA